MTTFPTRWGTWGWRYWHRGRLHQRAGYPTRRRAQAAEWIHRARSGAVTPRLEAEVERLTLAEYAQAWIEQLATTHAPATVALYAERLNGHVLPALGPLRLRELDRRAVRALLAEKRQAGYAANGVRLMRAALSVCLSAAVEDGLIPANPCLGIGRRSQRAAHTLTPAERVERIRPLSQAQQDALLAAAWTARGRWGLLFELMARTGLRPGEALALRGEDLDRPARQLRVERAVSRGEIRPTKTSEQRRVDLTPRLARLLATGTRQARGQGLLFPTRTGRPLDRHTVATAFRRLCRVAGLVDGQRAAFRLYDLRHTYASLALAAGAPLTYVSAQLGHRTPETTLRFYARWIPGQRPRWADASGNRTRNVRANVSLEQGRRPERPRNLRVRW